MVEETNLGKHARKEMERVGMFNDGADYGSDFAECIIATVETFSSKYGHSGGSAEVGAQMLERLLRFETL